MGKALLEGLCVWCADDGSRTDAGALAGDGRRIDTILCVNLLGLAVVKSLVGERCALDIIGDILP